jgi:hypothetical protein
MFSTAMMSQRRSKIHYTLKRRFRVLEIAVTYVLDGGELWALVVAPALTWCVWQAPIVECILA